MNVPNSSPPAHAPPPDETEMPTTDPPPAAGPAPGDPEGPPADALLRRLVLVATPAAPDAGPLDDALLLRWRAGALDADAAEAVEARLLADPEARALLVAYGVPPAIEALAAAEGAHPGGPSAVARAASLRQRRWRWGLGGAAVLAAALAAIVLRPYALPDTPPPFHLELAGGVATSRAQVDPAAEGLRRTFVPTSVITLRLAPDTPPAGAGTLWLPSVFAGSPEGPLLAVPHDALTAGDAGVWRLRTSAARVFQGPSGPRVLLVGVAATPLDVAGLTPQAARAAHPEARWFDVTVWWQADPDAPPRSP